MNATTTDQMAPISSSLDPIAGLKVPLTQLIPALLLVKSKPAGVSCRGM